MTRPPRPAALVGWLLGLVVAGRVLASGTRPLLAQVSTTGPDGAVAAAAALAGWAVLAWLALGVALALGETLGLPIVRQLAVLAPRTLRIAVRSTLGVGLVSGALPLAAPAQAVPAPPAVVRTVEDTPASPWPSLDRPAAPVPYRPGRPATYVVARGDTLWAIAAAHIPGEPTASRTAAAWPSWWRVNRATIGDDPSLIRPGQVLTVPGGPS